MPSHQDRVRRSYIDGQVYSCPSCLFVGGEDAMIEHALQTGHMPQPMAMPDRRISDRRHHDDDESRMADEGCPNM